MPANTPADPALIMIAGPNGAGKSTFYKAFLSHLPLPFLNADKLAHLTGIGAYDAANQIAGIRDRLIDAQQSFVLESVFSDPIGAKVDMLAGAVEQGYDVQLIFVGIEDAALSIERVVGRVEAGGHDVPEEKLVARFPRVLDNLARAIDRLPTVIIYDNSWYARPYRFVARFEDGTLKASTSEIPVWAQRFIST
jgi:predicted ABC-type ATPase